MQQECQSNGSLWRPLNSFQQLMLHWRQWGPYNAVHAIILDGPPDIVKLSCAIAVSTSKIGIGAIDFDASRQCYRYILQDTQPAQFRVADHLSDATISSVLAEQLNTTFTDQLQSPLRWLVLTTPEECRHVVIVSYDHVVADAFAIQSLIADVFRRMTDVPSTPFRPRHPVLGPPGRATSARAFRVGSALSLARQYFRLRHAYRIRRSVQQEHGCGTCLAPQAVTIPSGFARSSRQSGFGIQAAIMGAVVKAFAEVTPKRTHSRRRTGLGISTVISTRPHDPDEPVTFDAQLDVRTVFVPAPDDDIFEIVCRIQESLRGRRGRFSHDQSYAAAQSFAIRRIWPLLRIQNNPSSYRKLFPICAGVSPFRVQDELYTAMGPRLLRVLRACPTGPALPVVVAPTIRGSTIDLVLTYRRACFNEEQASWLLHRTVDYSQGILNRNVSFQRGND